MKDESSKMKDKGRKMDKRVKVKKMKEQKNEIQNDENEEKDQGREGPRTKDKKDEGRRTKYAVRTINTVLCSSHTVVLSFVFVDCLLLSFIFLCSLSSYVFRTSFSILCPFFLVVFFF